MFYFVDGEIGTMIKDACPKALNWVRTRFGEAGEAGLGLVSWNSFSGLWGIGIAPRCVVPSPGVIRARDGGREGV